MKYLKYLRYLLLHKLFVLIECTKMGIPVRGLLHDYTKFSPKEFFPYVNFFNRVGLCSYKPDNTEDKDFERAWFSHIKRNKHHWQYWTYPNSKGELIAVEIPDKYVKEMVADWKSACRLQENRGVVYWYSKHKRKLHFHPNTEKKIEKLIGFKNERAKRVFENTS